MSRNYPRITIDEEGEKWLGNGQVQMYKNNIVKLDEEIENGALVDITTAEDRYFGAGLLSRNSHITVGVLPKDTTDTFDRAFFKERIQFTYAYRRTLESKNITNCRLIFGKAGQLSGLTVGRYSNILVSQISPYGLEQRKDILCEVSPEALKENGQDVKGIYERNDIRVRAKEGLPLEKGYQKRVKLPTTTITGENGLEPHVDVRNEQKIGYLLDQKAGCVLLHKMVHGKRVMDCFSHTGSFALNAVYGNAYQVIAVGVPQTALDQVYANAKLNHLEDRIPFVEVDVFKYLDTRKEGQFSIIVLDPPTFTKSRKAIGHAYSGYKRINKQVMMLLERGDYLIICSYPRSMEIEDFEKMLRESAQETGVALKQASVTQQNHDHSILRAMGKTSYLKFYISQIV